MKQLETWTSTSLTSHLSPLFDLLNMFALFRQLNKNAFFRDKITQYIEHLNKIILTTSSFIV